MKVLVLEDDFFVMKGAFDYLNVKYYNGDLKVENIAKTQDFANLNEANTYDKIFVDISLHRNSVQDGYSFINTLKGVLNDLRKVVVITGSDKVENQLKQIGLPEIKVLLKPITFLDLKSVMP
jgi:CheY-like chemotaxis protein